MSITTGGRNTFGNSFAMSTFDSGGAPVPPMGGAPMGAPMGAPQQHPKAGTILTLGIIALVLSFCCALAGLIIGIIGAVKGGNAQKEAQAAGYTDSKVKTGRLLAIIAIPISIINIIVSIIIQVANA